MNKLLVYNEPMRMILGKWFSKTFSKNKIETFGQFIEQGIEVKEITQPIYITARLPTFEDLSHKNESFTKDNNESFKVEKISEKYLKLLYQRLPEISKDDSDQKEFFQREKQLKVELTSQTLLQQFPPKEKEPLVQIKEDGYDEKELKITRFLPEGKVPIAPNFSITFSQPMIKLSSVELVEAQEVPVIIEPKCEGRFRWIGTTSLFFEPKMRFEMSTKYKIKVPKRTKSQIGCEMKEDFSFEFETPTIKISTHSPIYDKYTQNPVLFIQFDQLINKNTFSYIKLHQGQVVLDIKEITVDEALKMIEKQNPKSKQNINYYIKNLVDGRFIFFTPIKPLPLATEFKVEVLPNCPSGEGPLLSENSQSFSFSTFNEMILKSYKSNPQLPYSTLTVNFSNKIDREEIDLSLISVEPPLKKMSISVVESYIYIKGHTKAKTDYVVKIKKGLLDIYGQKLENDSEQIIRIGPATQTLQLFNNFMYAHDPTEKEDLNISFMSVNVSEVNIGVYQVDPSLYKEYLQLHYDNYKLREKGYKKLQIGKLIYSDTLKIEDHPDDAVETFINLTSFLQYPKEKFGHLLVFIEPAINSWNEDYKYRPTPHCWIQSTNLSIDQFSISDHFLIWTNSLKDGKTLSDVEITVQDKKVISKDGLALFSNLKGDLSNVIIIAKKENDSSFLGLGYSGKLENSRKISVNVFDDRKIYKPKEEIQIKGFARKIQFSGYEYSLEYLDQKVFYFDVYDPLGKSYHKGKGNLTEYGSFHFSFKIPDYLNLGDHYIIFSGAFETTHYFQVQEFKTPEYNVTASSGAGLNIGSDINILKCKASYYSGGGLTGASTTWSISQHESNYRPPGWSKYNFQKELPYYFSFDENVDEEKKNIIVRGTTDSLGEDRVCVKFNESDRKEKKPITVTANVQVKDINNQVIPSSTSFIIHPSSLYVGIFTKRYFTKPDQKFPISFIVTTVNGVPKSDVKIHIVVKKHFKKREKLDIINQEKIVQEFDLISSNQAIEYDLELKEGGKYTISGYIEDEKGYKNFTEIGLISQGGEEIGPVGNFIEKGKIIMVADQETYQPGDTAEILLQTPFEGEQEGIVNIVCSSLIKTEKILLLNNSATIKLQIEKSMIPDVKIYVNISGTDFRVDENSKILKNEPKKPAYAEGYLELNIPPLVHTLNVSIDTKKESFSPGEEVIFEATVSNQNKEVLEKSEMTLIVVDEAILSLTGYSIQNPIQFFYERHNGYLYHYSLRSLVFVKDYSLISFSKPIDYDIPKSAKYESLFCLEKMEVKYKEESEEKLSFSDYVGGSEAPKPKFMVRQNFSPLAAFLVSETDKFGKCSFKFKLPDNLTRYRVTVVAAHKKEFFGINDTQIVANLPLMVRPSLPRFFNFGDEANVGVILQNQSENDISVNIGIRMTNLILKDKEKSGFKVIIPKSKRAIVKFPVSTEKCGISRIQIGAEVIGSNHADAVQLNIPVFTPSTSEAFSTYGEIDKGAIKQPILPPSNIFTQFGGLQITTQSTALSALTDAFIYLINYPYECIEQKTSTILSIIALQDVLHAFNAPEVPDKDTLEKKVLLGLDKIRDLQRHDGTFGFWRLDSDPNIFLSNHVAFMVAQAKLQGYKVPLEMEKKCSIFLNNILNLIETYMPKSSKITKNTLRAFALYIRSLNKENKNDIGLNTKKLFNETGTKSENISLDGLAWILAALHYSNPQEEEISIILKHFSNRVIETPETAHFTTNYGENNDAQLIMLYSDNRTDSIILNSLMDVDPKNSLIPKLVKGLLAHKKKGRWSNTSENCFVLLALKKYFNIYENITPKFIAKMWLGENYVGEQNFEGRSTDKLLVDIPMKYFNENIKETDLIISKEGDGRLYYRIGLTYAPKDLFCKTLSNGFQVSRFYEGVNSKDHVKKNQDGSWTFKEGELVRVKITMANTSYRYHVALIDKLPSGLEPLNPDLPTLGGNLGKEKQKYWWWGKWYQHENIRNERVEAYTTWLYTGVHEYSYVARATTVGRFIAPPTHAEEMYAPEIFGRSNSEIVWIE